MRLPRRESSFVDLLDSAKFIARHPLIRALALTGLALNALHFPAMTMLLPLHLSGSVRAGPELFGLFLAIESAGVLVATPMAPPVFAVGWRGASWCTNNNRIGWISGLACNRNACVAGVGARNVDGHRNCGWSADGKSCSGGDPRCLSRSCVGEHLAAISSAFIPLTMALGGSLIDLHGSRPLYAATGIVVAILRSRVIGLPAGTRGAHCDQPKGRVMNRRRDHFTAATTA